MAWHPATLPACSARSSARQTPVAVDSMVAKFDIGALYLQAEQTANRPRDEVIDVTPAPDMPAGTEGSTTTEW
jgi:hypothetical protein